MKPLARAGIRLGIHLLRSLPKGISGAEGRQLLSDALVIGAALAPHAPASVAPVLAGVLGWAGSAVVAPPVSADEALADMLEAVEAAIGAESTASPAPEPPVAGTSRVRPDPAPEIVVTESVPVAESAPLTTPAGG